MASTTTLNEYDRYIQSPVLKYKISELDYWRDVSNTEFPQLAMMARDTLAVPATGAGVEREFGLSGQVVTRLRARLHAQTISNIMMYKSYLIRCKRELKTFNGAGLRVGEEPAVNDSENEVPKEWREGWWNKRKKMSHIP